MKKLKINRNQFKKVIYQHQQDTKNFYLLQELFLVLLMLYVFIAVIIFIFLFVINTSNQTLEIELLKNQIDMLSQHLATLKEKEKNIQIVIDFIKQQNPELFETQKERIFRVLDKLSWKIPLFWFFWKVTNDVLNHLK